MPLLELQSFTVNYGAVEAVRGIDMSVEQGEIVALLGTNGAGKSSTLNAIVGLVPLTKGKVIFDGSDISGKAPESFTSAGLTLSPEGRRVFSTLSVAENLLMGAYTVEKNLVKSAYERVYDLFPILYERRDQFAGTLSGGQQQMLAVGRALMSKPRLLLLDEPSLGLAPQIVEQIFQLIMRLRGQGVTMLIVEQNISMALDIAEHAYLMAEGRIMTSGSAAQLSSSSSLKEAYLGAV